MFPFSKGRIALLSVPLLLGLVLYFLAGLHSQSLPHPLEGVNGPAGMSALPLCIAFGPDGRIYCSSLDGNVQAYLPDKKRFRSLALVPPAGHVSNYLKNGGYSSRLFFARDGQRMFVPLALSSEGASTQIVDMKTRRTTGILEGSHSGAVDFSADEKWMALGEIDGVFLVDLSQVKPLPAEAGKQPLAKKVRLTYPFFHTGGRVTSLDFSPDSKTLAIGYQGTIALFDVVGNLKSPRAICDLSGTALATAPISTPNYQPNVFTDNPFWIEWAPDGTKFATYSKDEIALFSPTLQKMASAPLPQPAPNALGANYSGERGYTISYETNSGGANLVWNHSGEMLFSGGDAVRRWNGATLALEETYKVPGPVALSPDEKTMVTSSNLDPGEYPHLQEWHLR